MEKRIQVPMDEATARSLRSGDRCLLSGVLYTARDAAHKRLCDCLGRGEKLPFEIQDAVIYYVGPTPAAPGHVIGSAGPTTSYRMDAFAPRLLALGQRGMIGKGKRSTEVVDAMKKYGAVYFGATGGAGALLSQCIVKAEVIAYEDLGPEALRRLEVRDLPVTVVIDSLGSNLYESGPAAYLASRTV